MVTWTSAPSASLPATPRLAVWSTCCREGIPSSKTLTGLRVRLVQTSLSLTSASARPCTWVREIPSTNEVWIEIESNPEKKDLGVLIDEIVYEAAMCACSPVSYLYPVLYQKQCNQQDEGSNCPLLPS